MGGQSITDGKPWGGEMMSFSGRFSANESESVLSGCIMKSERQGSGALSLVGLFSGASTIL